MLHRNIDGCFPHYFKIALGACVMFNMAQSMTETHSRGQGGDQKQVKYVGFFFFQ